MLLRETEGCGTVPHGYHGTHVTNHWIRPIHRGQELLELLGTIITVGTITSDNPKPTIVDAMEFMDD